MSFVVTWMNLEIIILSEVNQTKTNVQSKKKDTNELISKMEIDSPTQKTNLWLPKEKERERDKLKV